jgi:hypothetical protein
MEYRLIVESDEVTIITQSGKVGCVRESEPFDDTPRVATSDYYSASLTKVPVSEVDNLFEYLSEETIYNDDWEVDTFDSEPVLCHVLSQLDSSVDDEEWTRNDSLFPEFFPL